MPDPYAEDPASAGPTYVRLLVPEPGGCELIGADGAAMSRLLICLRVPREEDAERKALAWFEAVEREARSVRGHLYGYIKARIGAQRAVGLPPCAPR